jgi:hypothetical protein
VDGEVLVDRRVSRSRTALKASWRLDTTGRLVTD